MMDREASHAITSPFAAGSKKEGGLLPLFVGVPCPRCARGFSLAQHEERDCKFVSVILRYRSLTLDRKNNYSRT